MGRYPLVTDFGCIRLRLTDVEGVNSQNQEVSWGIRVVPGLKIGLQKGG